VLQSTLTTCIPYLCVLYICSRLSFRFLLSFRFVLCVAIVSTYLDQFCSSFVGIIEIFIFSRVLRFFFLILQLQRKFMTSFSLFGIYIISSRRMHASYPSSCLCFNLSLSLFFACLFGCCIQADPFLQNKLL
jgi:hypothetical protein